MTGTGARRATARRTAATLVLDLRRQAAAGYWFVALLAGLTVGAVLLALVGDPLRWWPLVVLSELSITSFYFAAVQILRERGEGILAAQSVTPLGPGEYLVALAGSLCLLALAEVGALVLAAHGAAVLWPVLAIGVALVSCLYVLYGVIVVADYETIGAFLLPSGLWTLVLGVPLLPLLGVPDGWWLWCHPLQPAVVLIEISFGMRPVWAAAPCALLGTIWCALLALAARARLVRAVTPRGAAS